MTNDATRPNAESLPDHGPIAVALSPEKASKSTFSVAAFTDVIGGSWMSTQYAVEFLTVDPVSQLEEGCLAVVKFNDGNAFMERFTTCGHDKDGRFCKRGSPEEMVNFGNIYMSRKEINGEIVTLVGRVVGHDREFPRPMPLTYGQPMRQPKKSEKEVVEREDFAREFLEAWRDATPEAQRAALEYLRKMDAEQAASAAMAA